jgi:hypothetical protein
MLADKNT